MAQVFGEKSEYLIKKDHAYFVFSILVLLVLLSMIFWYWENVVFHRVGIVTAVLFLFIFFWIRKKGDGYITIFGNFRDGRHGEYQICDELEALPNGYLIFQSVTLPGHRENIDFVVLGLTGIFTVEVKSHGGRISFDGEQLMRNGSRILEKDILKQAMDEAINLRSYLKDKVGKEFFVIPILAFSSKWASMRFGFNKVKGVHVVQKRFLNELILKNKEMLSPEDILLLKGELKQLVKINEKIVSRY